MHHREFFFLFLFFLVISCKTDPKTIKVDNQNLDILKGDDMVSIPSGTLSMGGDNDQALANEYPKHNIQVSSFYMDVTEVSNLAFLSFVEATDYVTIAERPIVWEELKKSLPSGTPKPSDEVLQPGALVFHSPVMKVSLNDPSQWWQWTIGAYWKQPLGPGSSIDSIMNHPVVQIAWEDAKAYATWAGKRLPTEVEWEWAARGGLENTIYPWGNESVNEGKTKANYWQGLFPYSNTQKDGYMLTAPVNSYRPNGYGLYNMAGNVWEWCDDWYKVDHYRLRKAGDSVGPIDGYNSTNRHEPHKVMRGGSFLCNDVYCSGYRNARREGSSKDTGLNHTGFRCAKDIE